MNSTFQLTKRTRPRGSFFGTQRKVHATCHQYRSIEVYRQAAFILTLYYDVETFEQIFPWHHAAGDFVVKADEGAVDVRLVTARQYAPMIEPNDDMPPTRSACFFFC